MFGRKTPKDGASQATLERSETGMRAEQPLELSEETRSVLDQFREQWDQLDSELRARQDRCIAELMAHCERLQHRRRDQAQTIESLKSDNTQLRKQWDELAVDAAQMRQQREQHAAEVDELRRKCDQSIAKAEQRRQERDELAAEVEQLREEREQLAAQADQLRRNHEKLILKADQLRRERDQSVGDVDHLRRQREELVREVAQLSEERDLLASELRNREDDFDVSPGQGSAQDQVSVASTREPIEPAEPVQYYPEDQVHELAGAMEQEHADEMHAVSAPAEEDEAVEPTPRTRSAVWDKLVADKRQRSERATADAPEASHAPQAPRAVPRCVQGARVTVIPDSDRNQIGINGQLHRVTCTGASLVLPQALKLDEYVVIEMASASERTRVEVRAFVRQVDPLVDGSHLVGFALVTQLEYGEVQGLRSP